MTRHVVACRLGEIGAGPIGSAALLALLALLTAGCQSRPPPVQAWRQALGPDDTLLRQRATDLAGSCAWARAPGAAHQYRRPAHVRGAPGGEVPVFARAGLSDDAFIGRLPTGTPVWVDGPLYHAESGQMAFALPVRGVSGRLCRAYVWVQDIEAAGT